MTLMAMASRGKRWSLGLVGAALVAGAGTAGPLAAQLPHRPPAPPRATPAAGFSLAPGSILAHQADFFNYVGGLVFDTSARGADRRVLMELRDPHDSTVLVGHKAELAPEVGATYVPRNWSSLGRVIARITLWSNSSYPHLHLRSGVTYVVVQSMRGHPDSLLAFFVATARIMRVVAIDTMNVRVERGGGPARFILSAADDDMCTPCNHTWCCPTERN